MDAFEELRENARQIEYRWEQLITARVGELGDKTLGADFRKVVSEQSQRVLLAGSAERFDDGVGGFWQ